MSTHSPQTQGMASFLFISVLLGILNLKYIGTSSMYRSLQYIIVTSRTVANLDLQPSWPFLPVSWTGGLSYSSARSVHNFRKNPSYTLILVQPHPSPSSTRYVHNLKKSQLYTYLGSAGHLVLHSSVRVRQVLYTILGKPSYTLTKAGLCVFMLWFCTRF